MLPVIIALFVLAAVLPATGFVRLLIRVRARLKRWDEVVAGRGRTDTTIADFNKTLGGDVRQRDWDEQRDLWWDISLIGSGLFFGATASIWSLFV